MLRLMSIDQEQRIKETTSLVEDLLIRKNRDYGNSFSVQFEKYGIMSALIRLDDKMARLSTLSQGHEAEVDESMEDTLLDLVGYGVLALVELGKKKDDAYKFDADIWTVKDDYDTWNIYQEVNDGTAD